MLEEQGGVCAICGNGQDAGYRQLLYVDHDHETGKVRGLLCQRCNSGIGHFVEDIDVVERAYLYMLKARDASR